jgi:hypothetical protein
MYNSSFKIVREILGSSEIETRKEADGTLRSPWKKHLLAIRVPILSTFSVYCLWPCAPNMQVMDE